MKLTKLQIRQFGKLKNREIILRDGINVIYGPNESGKSTIHSYIRAMFFGLPRYRGRAAKTDPYTRFEPWERPMDFGGRMEFSVDEKIFQIERSFYKGDMRESLVCITDGEQMSISQGDLSMLLGGISESVYDNTVSVGQLRSETDEGMVRELQNYMSNYEGTGSGDVDLQRASERLKKKKRAWELKKAELEEEHDRKVRQMEDKILYVEKEWRELGEQKEQTLEQIDQWERKIQTLDQSLIQEQKQNADREQERRSSETQNVKIREEQSQENTAGKSIRQVLTVMGFVLLLAAGVCLYAKWLIPGLITGSVGVFLLLGQGALRVRKQEEKEQQSANVAESMQEREWLQENLGQQESELHRIRKELSLYLGRKELLQQQLEEKEITLQNLREVLEEIRDSDEGREACQVEIQSLELALKVLGNLAGQMRSRIGGRLKSRMEEILIELTDGKYNRISIDKEMRITVWEWNREVALYQLSRGTVEQIYFALRMAVSEILCEEPMPVLLDDVFAMYDEQRLMQTLRWLACKKGQVVILTCHKREMELLRRMGVAANEIELEETTC